MKIKFKIFLFFVLVVAISPYSYTEVEMVGKFSYIEGRVDVLHMGDRQTTPVIREDLVRIGDIIRTKGYSKAAIYFKDKSILRLAPNTRVTIKEYKVDKKNIRKKGYIVLHRGKIRTIVKKSRYQDSFFIQTANAIEKIHGSDIITFYMANQTGILAGRGAVTVYNITSPKETIKIKKGEMSFINQDNPPSAKREFLDIEFKLHTKDTDLLKEKTVSTEKLIDKMEGWIVKADGNVKIRASEEKTWHSARINETIKEGYDIQTETNGTVEIRLENGNSISAKPDTHVSFKKLRRNPKTGEYENFLEAKFGKLKIVVERLKGKSKFEVKTPTAICGIRGTIMYLDISSYLTKAYFEGGGGIVTSTISGNTRVLSAGQNTYADDRGVVAAPQFTTEKDRISLDESWSAGEGIEGYTSPENNRGDASTVYDFSVGTTEGMAITEDATGAANIEEPFEDVPFEENATSTTTSESTATKTGYVAYMGYVGKSQDRIEFLQDEASPMAGVFGFSLPNSPEWSGSNSTATLSGNFININNYKLWTGDISGTAHDGGRFVGWVGGKMILGEFDGKVLAIYVDPSGHGGYLSAYITGVHQNNEFSGTGDLTIIKHEDLGMSPLQLETADKYHGEISGSAGSGSFELTGEEIICEGIGGATLSLEDRKWGIWHIEVEGSYTGGPTSEKWTLTLSGLEKEKGDAEDMGSPWFGTINGTSWDTSLKGEFTGFWFDFVTDEEREYVKAGRIRDGDLFGNPDTEELSFEMIIGGEWVELTDILNEELLGFSENDLRRFVTVPITERYTSNLLGSTANLTATMSLNLYENSHNNIWAGWIEGTYQGNIGDSWSLTLSNDTDSITLTGDMWDDGKWHAMVTGNVSGDIPISGEAGGTYSDGDFQGIAAGNWNF